MLNSGMTVWQHSTTNKRCQCNSRPAENHNQQVPYINTNRYRFISGKYCSYKWQQQQIFARIGLAVSDSSRPMDIWRHPNMANRHWFFYAHVHYKWVLAIIPRDQFDLCFRMISIFLFWKTSNPLDMIRSKWQIVRNSQNDCCLQRNGMFFISLWHCDFLFTWAADNTPKTAPIFFHFLFSKQISLNSMRI